MLVFLSSFHSRRKEVKVMKILSHHHATEISLCCSDSVCKSDNEEERLSTFITTDGRKLGKLISHSPEKFGAE